MSAVTASCLCGGVRLEVAGPPLWTCHCHCANCRRAHGAGSVTWAGFPADSLVVRAGADVLRRYVAPDTGSTWTSCGTCGSPLAYASPRWPGELHLSVGCLDDASAIVIDHHAYAEEAPGWCPITDALPRSAGC